jgi:DNA modification methylase
MTDLEQLRKQILPAFDQETLRKMKVPEGEARIFANYKLFPREILVKANWNYKEEDPHTSRQLANNLKRIGQVENIHVRELETGYFEIINGNHRDDSFGLLGTKYVMAYDHGKVSFEEAVRRAIETNETKFHANQEKLALLIEDLKVKFDDLEITLPYTEEELEEFSLSLETGEVGDVQEDNYDEKIEEGYKPKTKKADLYELNDHRLLCGDSTKSEDVKRLMNGKKAHMIYTDPPYNVNYAEFNKERGDGGKDWGEAYCSEWKDSMSDDDYQKFLIDFLEQAKLHTIKMAHFYVWYGSLYYQSVINAFVINNIPYDKVPITWVKQVAPLSWARYKRKYEPCIYGGIGAVNGNGTGARWFGPNNETNVWEISRDHNGDYVHPTQKPVALAARAINNSSKTGELVLDLFLGSGTTLIASDTLGRICYGMEYEPIFCDMIVKRFFKYCEDSGIECCVKRNGEKISTAFFEEDIQETEDRSQELEVTEEVEA